MAPTHLPVMMQEVLEVLAPKPGQNFADLTLGGGGHGAEIARRLVPGGCFLGLDRDPQMLKAGCEWVREAVAGMQVRLAFHPVSYERIAEVLAAEGITGGLHGGLMDLGLNSRHVDEADRGFSFRLDGALDARFNPAEGGPTAADLVNTAGEAELTRIFREFGDELFAPQIARRIVKRRATRPFLRTLDLAEEVAMAYPPKARHGRIDPATRVFQSLRIAVNDELGAVRRGILACMEALAPGGRLAVIGFHSGELRICKELFREASEPRPDPGNPYQSTTMEGVRFRQVGRKAIECSEQEAAENPRARSAKIRVIERIA